MTDAEIAYELRNAARDLVTWADQIADGGPRVKLRKCLGDVLTNLGRLYWGLPR